MLKFLFLACLAAIAIGMILVFWLPLLIILICFWLLKVLFSTTSKEKA